MQPVAAAIRSCFSEVSLGAPEIPFTSCLSGELATPEQACDPAYWAAQLRQPVRFDQAVKHAVSNGAGVLLDIGPGTTAASLAMANVGSERVKIVSCCSRSQRGAGDVRSLLAAVGELWASGVEVDWNAVYADQDCGRVPLPTYPYQKKRCWIEPRRRTQAATAAAARAPLEQVSEVSAPATGAAAGSGPAGEGRPRNDTEMQLVELWRELLGVERISIHDSFFALGGQSLLATRLLARIRETMGVELPLQTVFESPTVEALAIALLASQAQAQDPRVLEARLSGQAARAGAGAANDAAETPGSDDSLSAPQWRMWLFEQRQGSSSAYNIVSAIRIGGLLDVPALQWAIDQTVRRHESLRTAFVEESGQARQVVCADVALTLEIQDAPELAGEHRRLEERVKAIADRPLPLGVAPLMRVVLLRLDPENHVLVSVLHHVIADGWSLRILERDLSRFYDERRAGRRADEPPHSFQYRHFVHWHARRLATRRVQEQLEYWKSRLADAPQRLNLPVDGDLPASTDLSSRSHIATLSPELVADLRALGERCSASLFMVLGAALNVVLALVCGQDDICVGTPVANRGDSRFDDVVGLFSNTVVLRSHLDPGHSFDETLESFKNTCLEALSRQDLPYERVVEALRASRHAPGAALFQVLFALHATEGSALRMQGLRLQPVQLSRHSIDFELMLEAFVDDQGGTVVLSLRRDLFSSDAGRRLLDCWLRLLHDIARDSRRRLSELYAALAHMPAPVVEETSSETGTHETGSRDTGSGELDALIGALEARLPAIVTRGSPVLWASDALEFHAASIAALRLGLRALVVEPGTSMDRVKQAIGEGAYDVVVLSRGFEDAGQEALSGAIRQTRPHSAHTEPEATKSAGELLLLTATEQARLDMGLLLERARLLQTTARLDSSSRCFIKASAPLEVTLHVVALAWVYGHSVCFADPPHGDQSSCWTAIQASRADTAFLQPADWRLVAADARGCESALEDVFVLADLPESPQTVSFAAPRVHSLWSSLSDGPFLVRNAAGNVCAARRLVALNTRGEPLPAGITGSLALVVGNVGGQRFVPLGLRGTVEESGCRLVTDRGSPWVNGRHLDLAAVENALLSHPAVCDTRVLSRRAEDDSTHAVAYVAINQPIEPARLGQFVAEKLGRPAIPGGFVLASRLPYASDGSVCIDLITRGPVIDGWVEERVAERCCEQLSGASFQLRQELRPQAAQCVQLASEEFADSAAGASSVDRSARQDSPADTHPGTPAMSIGAALRQDGEPSSLVETLLRTVARYGQNHLIHIVDANGSEHRQSYTELLAQARRVLGLMRRAGIARQDRVLLQLSRNADMLVGFWACVLGGIVPVAAAVPARYDAEDKDGARLINAWSALSIRAVLTDSANQHPLQELARSLELQSLPCVHIDSRDEECAHGEPDRPHPDEVALLLLTSGSTGKPKAVMQTHRALVSRTIATAQQHGFDDRVISFNWMPLDHVGGLVMFHLLDVYLGAQQIHCPAALILSAPLRWLDALSRYRVTNTWAPNFAFALVNDRIEEGGRHGWDLSALSFVLNGGEAIVSRTARTFLRKLSVYGLRSTAMKPAWGMSETCSGITFNTEFSLETGSDDDAFVDVGRPIPGVSARIVDEDNRVVDEGRTGRLQVRGAPITQGYFNHPDATRQSFSEDGWFVTGDLGVMRNGSVTITGREKDLIIINGLNYHGHELEQIVERVEGVVPAHVAACGVRGSADDTDRLAVFFSMDDGWRARGDEVCRAVRRDLLQRAQVYASYLIPLPQDAFPRTSIGKIQRAQLAERFRTGEFREQMREGERAQNKSSPAWYFEPVWIRKDARSGEDRVHCAVVVCSRDALRALQPQALGPVANRVFYVVAGASFERAGENVFTVRLDTDEDLQQVLQVVAAEGDLPEVFIHAVWNSAGAAEEGVCGLPVAVQSLLLLARRLATLQPQEAERRSLTVLTRGGFAVDPEDEVDPYAGALLGLVRSIAHEMPWLACRQIDVSPRETGCEASQIASVLRSRDKEDLVALRGSRRFVSRLMPLFPEAAAPVRLRRFQDSACYLITGGLGGVGAHLARHLLSSYPDTKVLVVGRTPARLLDGAAESDPSVAAKAAAYKELAAYGRRFAYEAADVCDAPALREVLNRQLAFWQAPLEAVFHLAGEITEALVTETEPRRFAATLAPKMKGALALEQALEGRGDVEVHHFSSANGYFGGLGVAAYATANSFLDAFAASRRQRGRRHYSHAWSMWDEVGMSRGYRLKQRTVSRGFSLVTPEQGLTSLRVLAGRPPGSALIGLDAGNLHMAAFMTGAFRPLYGLSIAGVTADQARAVRALRVRDRFGIEVAAEAGVDERERAAASEGMVPGHHSPQLSDIESRLAALWSELLGTPVNDRSANFFELGGDSIMAVQVVARANQAGIVLRPRQVFEAQTLGELAASASSDAKPAADQAPLTGRVPLAPIQRWFFERGFGSAHHMNQSVLLRAAQEIDRSMLERALRAVVDRHDMLRARFSTQAGEVVQTIAPEVQVVLEEHRLIVEPGLSYEQSLANAADAVQAGLNLEQGPLLRAVIFRCGEARDDRILIAVHHLVVDGVSWRIILDDLEAAYIAIADNRSPALPPRTSSYRQWVESCTSHVSRKPAHVAAEYWLRMGAPPEAFLQPVKQDGRNTRRHEQSLELALDAAVTNALLLDAASARNVKFDELLLAAFFGAWRAWRGGEQLYLALEGHGRDELTHEWDLSRTVGWFTAMYPVLLSAHRAADTDELVHAVADTVSHVPHRGVIYPMLRYLGPPEVREPLARRPWPSVSFNYLGRFDAGSDRLFAFAAESPGRQVAADQQRVHELDVVGCVIEGQLRCSLTFSADRHDPAAMRELARLFEAQLRGLAASEGATDQRFGLETIMPATPMQTGLLYETEVSGVEGTYVSQLINELEGSLNATALQRAWQAVVDRHATYRTGFAKGEAGGYFQRVHRQAVMPWTESDWRDFSQAQQEKRFTQLVDEDGRRGFDLSKPPLARVQLVRLADSRYRMVLSEHHAISDGWSRSLVLRELATLYRSFLQGTTDPLPPAPPFKRYVEWLQARDDAASRRYWSEYLRDIQGARPLAFQSEQARSPCNVGRQHRRLSTSLSAQLGTVARARRTTVGALAQAAWVSVLSLYTASNEVRFLTTHSGRPGDLPGVESIAGPFVNTVPVRAVLSQELTVVECARLLQKHQVELTEHGHLPLGDICRLAARRPIGELFNTLFVVENFPLTVPQRKAQDDLEVVAVRSLDKTEMPLGIMMIPGSGMPGSGMEVVAYYREDSFDAAAVKRLIDHYEAALAYFAAHPHSSASSALWLAQAEREAIASWHARRAAPSDDRARIAVVEF